MKVIMTHRAWWMSDEPIRENITEAEAQEFINTNQEHIDCSLWKYTMVDDNYVLYEAPPQTYAVFIDYKDIVSVLSMIDSVNGSKLACMKVLGEQYVRLTPVVGENGADIKSFKMVEFMLNKHFERQDDKVCPECAEVGYKRCCHSVWKLRR